MKNLIEALKNKVVTLSSINLPFAPMSKVIASNPRIMIGVTNVRHIQRADSLSVWPCFTCLKCRLGWGNYNNKKKLIRKKHPEKEMGKNLSFLQYNDTNKCHNMKLIRMNFPLHKLDDITEGLLELCQGLLLELCQGLSCRTEIWLALLQLTL